MNGINIERVSHLYYNYLAYGCNLVSDIPFLQLNPGNDPSLDTISIRRCEQLPEEPADAHACGPVGRIAPGYFSLRIADLLSFTASNGNTLFYRPENDDDPTSIQLFLLGTGLGAVLMQRKFLVLHGNSIEINGSCIVCVGPSGAGKSTTAAGLMKRGYRVLSDDVCAIDAQGRVVPGMPHIKLWQEAAEHLQVNTDEFSRVRPEMEKFRMPMGDAFCADAISVKTIYVLTTDNCDKITAETISGREMFQALKNNTYRLGLIDGLGLGPLHFQQLAALSKQVQVRVLKRPNVGFELDRLLDFIVADVAAANGQL